MGFTVEQVESLSELMYSLDYDSCDKKIDRVISKGMVHDREKGMVLVKKFHDTKTNMGQCAILSLQYISRLKTSPEFGGSLDGENKLKVAYCGGHTEEYFIEGKGNHYWFVVSNFTNAEVIGVSKDHKIIFCLFFIQNKQNKMFPGIKSLDSGGNSIWFYRDGEMIYKILEEGSHSEIYKPYFK